MTRAISAAVHGGGTGGSGSGWAVAVAAAPKSNAPPIRPVPIAEITARRVGRAEDNMAGSFNRWTKWP